MATYATNYCLRLKEKEAILTYNDKHIATAPIFNEDIEKALEDLKKLNICKNSAGQTLASLVEIDDFQPWWFVQEKIMWEMLVPLTQYHSILDLIFSRLPRGTTITIIGAPKSLLNLLDLLEVRYQPSDNPALLKLRTFFKKLKTSSLQFLLALVSAISFVHFLFKKPASILYIIDQVDAGRGYDLRLKGIYQQLQTRNLSFLEFAHCNSLTASFRNIFKRRRPVVLLEPLLNTIRWVQNLFLKSSDKTSEDFSSTLNDFEVLDKQIAKSALALAANSARNYLILKKLISYLQPNFALALDDSRHANEFLASCKQNKLATLTYQHGLTLNKYFVGHACYGFNARRSHTADYYCFWSEYFRNKLIEFSNIYTNSNTFVAGPIRELFFAPALKTSKSEKITVVVISEPKLLTSEILPYLEQLNSSNLFRLILKVRPGQHVPTQYDNIALERIEDLKEAFELADVVIGCYSSLLYEAICYQIPLVVIPSSSKYFAIDLIRNKLAQLAEKPSEIVQCIVKANQLPSSELAERREIIWGPSPLRNCDKIFELVLNISDASSIIALNQTSNQLLTNAKLSQNSK
jgi:hypothetical protein